ncbi:hypothetical protein [Cohnella hongkongensis]|uniref:Uncharacterized protein n=1 Tax=Cohnella hongkongensis TaxID=178337 RepID=A0ABV9FDB1_9BACL
MKQSIYGLALFVLLALPPVAGLMESLMIAHMHMQMPLLVASGFLMAKEGQLRFPRFWERWNASGVPGILLFAIIAAYWMLPRAMDEALASPGMEAFKFASLPLLCGVPLRDSWPKIGRAAKCAVMIGFALLFAGMGLLYVMAPVQLCNNYLLLEQIALGWGFLTTAICMAVFLIYRAFARRSGYE